MDRKFEIRAFFDYHAGSGIAQHVDVRLTADTREQAEEIAALFPKSVKAKAWTMTHGNGSKSHFVGMWADFISTGATGAKNETSIKRYRSFLRHAEKQGFVVEFSAEGYFADSRTATNQYLEREPFETAIA